MNETLPMVRLLPATAGPFTRLSPFKGGRWMATVEDIFLQELLRVFNNSGGKNPDGTTGVQYGGTGQTGTITGNPTGGSTQSPGSTDPYAGITVVYNPVTGQTTTANSALALEIQRLSSQNPNILVGEELVLILKDPYAGIAVVYDPITGRVSTSDPTLLQSVTTAEGVPIFYGEDLILDLSPRIVQGEDLILYLSPPPKIVQGEELVLTLPKK